MNKKQRLAALLWSVLLCLGCLCACGGEAPGEALLPVGEDTPQVSTPAETPREEPIESKDTAYSVSFGEYIVEYTLPAAWESLYNVQMQFGEPDNYEVGFYHKASAEFGGWLFSLALFTDEEYLQFPETTVVAEDDGVTLVCMRPSDVQFDLEYAEEYLAMSGEIHRILTTVALTRADGEMGDVP